jgi:hypothetical protein
MVGSAIGETDDRVASRQSHLELFGELAAATPKGMVDHFSSSMGPSLSTLLQVGTEPGLAAPVARFFARTCTNEDLWEETNIEALYK